MRLHLLLTALAVANPAYAQIEPIWSSTESEVIPYAAQFGRTEHVLLQDGNAFMVASETSRDGLASSVRLAIDGSAVTGQFGHQPIAGGRLSPEAVLATQGDRVLLAMTELDNTRALVAMVDTAGNLRWVRPRYAGQARFLANGDVLLASGNRLIRVNGSDGDTMWVRNLLELHPHAGSVAFQLPTAIDTLIPLSLSFSIGTPDGVGIHPDPLLVSLDAASGAVQWSLPRAPGAARVFEACAPVKLASDTVRAYFEMTNGQVDAVLERRNDFNGTLLWSTRVPAVDYSNGPCALESSNSLVALSTHDEVTQSTLVALDHAGGLRWRTTLPSTLPASLRAAADGAILVATQQALAGGLGTVAQRRRVSDGAVDWSVEIPARNVDWRLVGSELRIAWSLDNLQSELHLERRVAATGALIDAHSALAQAQARRRADVEFVGIEPYAAMAGLGPDQRGVRVRRLDPDTGAPIWEQLLELDEYPSRIDAVRVQGGAASRLLVHVVYVDSDLLRPALRQAVLSIDSASGALLWQSAWRSSPFGIRSVVSGPNGEVHVVHPECIDPPACTQEFEFVAKLSPLGGQVLWDVPVPNFTTLLGARALDLVVLGGGGIGILGAASGDALWSQPVAGALQSIIAAANGDLYTSRQVTTSGQSRSFVERRSGVDGLAMWSVDPGAPGARVSGPLIATLADGDLLLSARLLGTEPGQSGVSRPLLARIDSASGQVEWSVNPTLQNGRWMSVRPVEGGSVSHRWARSLRYQGSVDFEVEERLALTTVALADGFIGAEHQYAQAYDPPLASRILGNGLLTRVTATGSPMVENYTVGANGIDLPRLERWPAGGTNHGDLRLHLLGEPGRITAQGASTSVEIEIENASPGAVSDVLVGFASTRDGLIAQLRGCELTVGVGTCPIVINSGIDQVVALGSGASMRLRYDISDPDFQPRQARGGDGARGLFHIDPPYAFGDHDLGDNLAEIRMALGGTSIGFE
ncbi:MAG: PQQ-like beta-propeller repeat protein [Rhodanobacteraceae bacterium]|nr:PQQ-like beta-propeller repeat protein [Rhodanobacteraceae bacterium]